MATGGTCTAQADITSVTAGDQVNISGDLTSNGGNSGPATDTLEVLPPGRLVVLNPGFEADCPATDGSFTTAISAWTKGGATNLSVTLNPTTTEFPADVPEGVCSAGVNATSLSQVLAAPLADATSYVLEVAVGDRTDTAFPGFEIQMRVDGVVRAVADEGDATPTDGEFATATARFTTIAADAGKALEIRLISDGVQTGFDDVRVSQEDPGASGVPSFVKSFAPATIEAGTVTTLTFTIDHSAGAGTVTGLAFSDTLPSPLVIDRGAERRHHLRRHRHRAGRRRDPHLRRRQRQRRHQLHGLGRRHHCRRHRRLHRRLRQHLERPDLRRRQRGLYLRHPGGRAARLRRPPHRRQLRLRGPALADGGFDPSVPSWTPSGAATLNPTTAQLSGEAPEGDHIAGVNAGQLEQTGLGALLDGVTYALVVDVGDRQDLAFVGYTLELLADGVTFASVSDPVTPADDGFVTASLTATAGAAENGKALGIRLVSAGVQTVFDHVRLMVANAPPVVTVTSPPDASFFAPGASVTFAATALDPEDGDLAASIAWTSSIDGNIGSGASFATTTLSLGVHTVTASVTDSGGDNGSDAVTVTISVNAAPVVTITSPADSSTANVGDSVAFAATALDPEDGDLAAGLAWTSSIDGNIGSGGSFNTTTLSAGIHTITASVTDSGGTPGSADIQITLEVNDPPVVTITSPAGSIFTVGTSVAFAATALDPEDGDLAANLDWTSDLDGNIGSGASFSTAGLSTGTHTITASVTDSGGVPGTADVTVAVTLAANPGFEADCPASGFSSLTTFWLQSGNSVTYRPTTAQFPAGVPEGSCSGAANADTLSQVVAQTAVADTTYALTVDVGDRLDTIFPGFTIQLLIDGAVRATADETDVTVVDGTFASVTTRANTTAADAGKTLEVRLISSGIQTNFDNVRLVTEGPGSGGVPSFAKAFAPALIEVGAVSTLTFTVDNSGGAAPVTGLAFSDTLPARLVVAPTPATMTTCGGIVTAPAGGATISFSGGTVNASDTCIVEVDVTTTDTTAASTGTHTNTSGLLNTDSGTGGAATAELGVVLIGLTGFLDVDNPGFEGVAVADGGFDTTIPSWTGSVNTVTYNPTAAQFPAGVPDGRQLGRCQCRRADPEHLDHPDRRYQLRSGRRRRRPARRDLRRLHPGATRRWCRLCHHYRSRSAHRRHLRHRGAHRPGDGGRSRQDLGDPAHLRRHPDELRQGPPDVGLAPTHKSRRPAATTGPHGASAPMGRAEPNNDPRSNSMTQKVCGFRVL